MAGVFRPYQFVPVARWVADHFVANYLIENHLVENHFGENHLVENYLVQLFSSKIYYYIYLFYLEDLLYLIYGSRLNYASVLSYNLHDLMLTCLCEIACFASQRCQGVCVGSGVATKDASPSTSIVLSCSISLRVRLPVLCCCSPRPDATACDLNATL